MARKRMLYAVIHGENVFRDAVQIPNQREFFVSSQPFSKLLQMKIADIDLGPGRSFSLRWRT